MRGDQWIRISSHWATQSIMRRLERTERGPLEKLAAGGSCTHITGETYKGVTELGGVTE